jgi:hypothetical protein
LERLKTSLQTNQPITASTNEQDNMTQDINNTNDITRDIVREDIATMAQQDKEVHTRDANNQEVVDEAHKQVAANPIMILPNNIILQGPSVELSQQETRPTKNPTLIQQRIPQYNTIIPPKRNEAWGASINSFPNTIFRLYFQNINRMQHTTTHSRWQPHCEYMKDTGIDISGLAETNSNWHHKQLTKNIKATANSVFSHSSKVFLDNAFNPPDRSAYLPGGCMQICTDHWTARIIMDIKDPR